MEELIIGKIMYILSKGLEWSGEERRGAEGRGMEWTSRNYTDAKIGEEWR